MSTPVRASDRDLRALAAIVSQDRPDLSDGKGLPPFTSTEVVYGLTGTDVTVLPGYGVSP
jgi:hypothetical protein